MHLENTRKSTIKFKIRIMMNMLRKERKLSDLKCSSETREGRKRERKKTKHNEQERAISMADIDSTVSIITLNVNSLKTSIQRQRLS